MPNAEVMHEKPIRRRRATGEEYWLTLSHEPGAMKTRRVEQRQVPLLSDHQSTLKNTLGQVKRLWQEGRTTHAEYEFYDLPDDPEITKAKHMLDNGHHGFSVGLSSLNDVRRTGSDSYTAHDWEVGELTVTPTPADDETKAYRLLPGAEAQMTAFFAGENTMADEQVQPAVSVDALTAAFEKANAPLLKKDNYYLK